MPRHNIPVSSQRALQIWPYLLEQRNEKSTITYAALSERVYGHRAAQSLNRSLNKLCAYCKSKGLPQLPVLVVSKRNGKPSAGPDVYSNSGEEIRQVLDYDWRHVPAPTLETLQS